MSCFKILLVKVIITCLLLFFSVLGFAQTNPCDSIVWRANRPLKWNDFKAKPESNVVRAANTHSGFVRSWVVKDYLLKTVMVANFNPCLSWSKNKGSDRLLRHEQLHFDITEIFKRLYYKRVAEAAYTPSTINGLMKSIYQNIIVEMQIMQENYDVQTHNSLDADQQAVWQQKVAGLLNGLRAYDKRELSVELPRE